MCIRDRRSACATLEPRYPKLKIVAGTAEATALPDHSIDLITVAQAMHWFDLGKTRAEFARILKRGGYCAILYNHRRRSGDAFHDGWEELLINLSLIHICNRRQDDRCSDPKDRRGGHIFRQRLEPASKSQQLRHPNALQP